MQLKRQTDYAMRVLMFLGTHPQQVCTIAEIATAFGISRHHLFKVGQHLGRLGMVATIRGKHGGLRLAQPPQSVNVGAVVRAMEGNLEVIDCARPSCPIRPACTLKVVLDQARDAFLETLERYTLADLLDQREQPLLRLLGR